MTCNAAANAGIPSGTPSQTILVIDDKQAIRMILTFSLAVFYLPLVAGDGGDVLDLKV